MVSVANNHSLDYGIAGMVDTLKHLQEQHLPYAGAGLNLSQASSPQYVDTAMGRVALLACCSTVAPGAEAITQRPDHPGRPGVNPLHFKQHYRVDKATLKLLDELKQKLGLDAVEPQRRNMPVKAAHDLSFLGQSFAAADTFSTHTEPDPSDLQRHIRRIEEAKQMADWVFVSCHCHEKGNSVAEPPAFLESFAHACIDAGADAFIGHGPHCLRGIEIYKDRPIFLFSGQFYLSK